MNTFFINGVVRERPKEIVVDGERYLSLVVVLKESHTILPIYAKGDSLVKKITRLGAIGAEVEVQGKFTTTEKYYEGRTYIRLYLICEKFARIKAPKVKFDANIVIEKMLGIYDTEDLLKEFRKKARSLEKNDKQCSDWGFCFW